MDPHLYDDFYAIERTHWWCVGMRRIFHRLAARALGTSRRPRLVDIGCGTGIVLEEFGRYGRILGLDMARPALEYARRRNPSVPLVQADLSRLPLATSSQDAVLMLDVLEHIDDDLSALKEVRRVLRPGGFLMLNVPAFPSLWSDKDVANHHRRRYTRTRLSGVVREAGLVTERLTFTNMILFPPIWLVRRVQRLTGRHWNSDAEYYPNGWVNRSLRGILAVECGMLRWFDLPFGTSLTCLARRR